MPTTSLAFLFARHECLLWRCCYLPRLGLSTCLCYVGSVIFPRTFGKLGQPGVWDGIAAVSACLDDPDGDVEREAVDALTKAASRVEQREMALFRARFTPTQTGRPWVQAPTFKTVLALSPDDPSNTAPHDKTASTRRIAVEALPRMVKKGDARAVAALSVHLRDGQVTCFGCGSKPKTTF